jgi:hypothetical protein
MRSPGLKPYSPVETESRTIIIIAELFLQYRRGGCRESQICTKAESDTYKYYRQPMPQRRCEFDHVVQTFLGLTT